MGLFLYRKGESREILKWTKSLCTSLGANSALNGLIKTPAVGLALCLQEAKGFHSVFNAEDFYWLALKDSRELVELGVTLVVPHVQRPQCLHTYVYTHMHHVFPRTPASGPLCFQCRVRTMASKMPFLVMWSRQTVFNKIRPKRLFGRILKTFTHGFKHHQTVSSVGGAQGNIVCTVCLSLSYCNNTQRPCLQRERESEGESINKLCLIPPD